MALATKLQDEQVVIIDELVMSEPRTKEMSAILDKLGLADSTTLVATEATARTELAASTQRKRLYYSPTGRSRDGGAGRLA